MSDYSFSMPWAPSVNVWKTPFRNRMILSKRGREYRILAIERCKELGIFEEGLTESLMVSVTLNPPTLRRYDVDNFTKSLFDALSKAGFWVDDEQVHELHINKGEKVKDGRVDVRVWVLD